MQHPGGTSGIRKMPGVLLVDPLEFGLAVLTAVLHLHPNRLAILGLASAWHEPSKRKKENFFMRKVILRL